MTAFTLPWALATHYVRAFIAQACTALWTDRFGRSDTRANLRRFFEVDWNYIAHATIATPVADGKMTGKDVARTIKQYKIDVEKVNPVGYNQFATNPNRVGAVHLLRASIEAP